MKGKPTKAEMQLRTEEILRIRLDGAEIWDVREYVREQEQEKGSLWELAEGDKPLSDSQLWRYIAKSDKLIAEKLPRIKEKAAPAAPGAATQPVRQSRVLGRPPQRLGRVTRRGRIALALPEQEPDAARSRP